MHPNTKQRPIKVESTPHELRTLWAALNLGEKLRDGMAAFEPSERYLDRSVTQVGQVRLKNGWVIALAHRWRTNASAPWSTPDPKFIRVDEVSLYTH